MNKETLKQLTHAHSWLGLILSGALMIVFFCGSLSFFKANILAWEQYHHKTSALPEAILTPGEISKKLMAQGYHIPADHRVLLLFPTQNAPYYHAIFSSQQANGQHQRHSIYFDPVTGKKLTQPPNQYYLAEYLYKLHIDLNIPYGVEIVGIVSVLFFVIILSGLLIHLKKMIKYFFQYRLNKNKDTYLDGHNLIGVTTLPYTLMYALTGVVFNLSILYQASFGGLVFQNDIQALSQTSGFDVPTQFELSGQPMDWKTIDLAIAHANQALPGAQVYLAKIWGFSDQNAQMQLRLVNTHDISKRLTIDYPLNNYLNYQAESVTDNPVQASYHILKQLHYGHFGGITLQFVYFVLGLGCCYLILSGNLIWLEKQAAKRNYKQGNLNFVRAMTLCLSAGCLIAVALCFIGARFLPAGIASTDALPLLFSTGLVFSFMHAYFTSCSTMTIVIQAVIAGILFAIAPLYDTVLLLLGHITQGDISNLLLVNSVCLLVTAFCLLFSRKMYARKQTKS